MKKSRTSLLGSEALNKKIDTVKGDLEGKIDAIEANLSRKLEDVAVDLREHRADTEAHRKGWRVREE